MPSVHRPQLNLLSVLSAALGNCTKQGVDNVIELTGEEGHMFSPMYPTSQDYPHNMTCSWTITVPEGKYVRLKIKELFFDSDCNAYLEIRDGKDSSAKLLERVCWLASRGSFFSSGRHLWARFHSPDSGFRRKGFYATYDAVNIRE